MNLDQYKHKTVKIDVERDGQSFHYTATILYSDDRTTAFTDKFGKEIIVPSDRITFVEVVE